MTKVVLVDDEAIVRRGIACSVGWEKYGVEIAAEAPNGEIALEKCLEIKPDIVITDIRMPQMDGLELARRLKEQLPDTRIIILSGYEDFAYAKQAIVIGVNEYLVKPVNEQELIDTIRRLQEQIREEQTKDDGRKQSENLVNRNIAALRTRFAHRLLMREFNERDVILSEASELKVNLSGCRYGVFLIDLDIAYEILGKGMEKDREIYKFAVCNIGEEILFRNTSGKGMVIWTERMSFVGIMSMERLERFSQLDILREVQEALELYLELDVSISLGNIYPSILSIPDSYEEAKEAMAERFYTGRRSILAYSEYQEEKKRDYHYPLSEEKKAVKYLEAMDEESLCRLLNDIFEAFAQARIQETKVKDFCCRLVNALINRAEELGVDSFACPEKSLNVYVDIQKFRLLDEIRVWVLDLAGKLQQGMRDKKSRNYSNIVGIAMRYMREHYQQDLTLSEISDRIGVSPSYFSKVFKQETGINFVDWLNQQRIEKAQQMMREGNSKIYEIAEEVGFSDYKYFSMIFKKYTGCTPKQYQKGRIK